MSREILGVADRFEPLIAVNRGSDGIGGGGDRGRSEGGSGDMKDYMLEPTVASGAMPVLDAGRDGDDSARLKELCGLAPLLVKAFTGDAYKNLLGIVVDVPVVAAAGFESDIAEGRVILLQSNQIRLPCKVLLIELVRESFGKWKIFSVCNDCF